MYTDKKTKAAAILAYPFTWIGVLIALIIRDKDDALSRHHLNQGIVLAIGESISALLTRIGGVFAWVGELADIAILVLAIMGIVRAVKGSDEPLPIIGGIQVF